MPEEIPFSWFGRIGFLSLIILLIFLLGATMGIIIGSKSRLKKLEDRVAELEAIDHRITHIWDQDKTYEQLKERFDRLEASISSITKPSANGLDRLQKNIAEESPRKHEFSSSSKISENRYHTVISGETLYGISLKYGLTVKKLRTLNQLNDRSVIHPKQKLLAIP